MENGDAFVAVWYVKGTYEWFKIDKDEYLKIFYYQDINLDHPFPCLVTVDMDNDIYIHSMAENN
jgi:hypothetical protein